MQSENNFPLGLRILIPLLFGLAINFWPRPLSLETAYHHMQLAHSSNRQQAEIVALRQAVSLEPWRADFWEKLGQDELAQGNPENAIAAYQRASLLGKLSPAGNVALGDALLRNGQKDAALEVWQASLRTDSTNLELIKKLFELQCTLKQYEAALGTLQAWIELQPADPQVNYQMALMIAASQPKPALDYLGKAKNDKALERSINNALQQENEAYRRVLLGRTLGDLGRWDLANLAFQDATRLEPGYAEAWAFLGESRQQLGLDGWKDLQEAQHLDPSSVVAQAVMALYWRQQGRPELGLVYLHSAAEAEPEQAIWQVELGNTLAEMGNFSSALQYYQRAVELEPGNIRFLEALAQFCASNEVAIDEIGLPAARKALELAGDDPSVLDTMGLVMMASGDYPSSQRFLLRALQKDNTYALAQLHLGQLYLNQGESQLAYESLSIAAGLDWKDQQASQSAKFLLSRYFNGSG
jgi:tetratricopeptide (TPR) repeat protein